MKNQAHGTALADAAATASGGDGKKSSLPTLKGILYFGCVALGLLLIGIAIFQEQAVPALAGYVVLGLAVLLEPRTEAKHPVAEVVRLRASTRTVVVPVVTDQDGEMLIGVTRVYKAGKLFEESNWKAEALEREALLEHYQLMGLPARGAS